jgi:hypothetical protein
VRKERGEVSLIKCYDEFEGMWVKLVCGKDVFYICGVYAPPRTDFDFGQVLRSLESDCIHFRQLGKVIVMGDFNARIDNSSIVQESVGVFFLEQLVIKRVVRLDLEVLILSTL